MSVRTALVVGINYYEAVTPLFGCVDDAQSVESVLSYHDNVAHEKNFTCNLITASKPGESVSRAQLKDDIEKLFNIGGEIALLYFAGHGHIQATGGYLLATDSKRGDEGVSLTEILTLANESPATNKVIVLDSCHSGIAGNYPLSDEIASLANGVTVLTASTKDQYATEENGQGIFTTLFVDALRGGAANLTGDITPGSIYAHIDQSLGNWDQRPVFKANIERFVSLRKVAPPIDLNALRRLSEFFPKSDDRYALDPSYEPELEGRARSTPSPDPSKTEIFELLQKFNRLNLLVPTDAAHMWNAAMESKSCQLTPLGKHYWRLSKKKRI